MTCLDSFIILCFFFFQAEDGIRDLTVTGVQTCALPISRATNSQVCSGTADQPITTGTAIQGVVAAVAQQDIVAFVTIERVAVAIADDDVVQAIAVEVVVSFLAAIKDYIASVRLAISGAGVSEG